MTTERIESHQLAIAAAQGVAIALAARNLPDEFDLHTPIIAGGFPNDLFEVTLAQDGAGRFTVKSIQPFNVQR